MRVSIETTTALAFVLASVRWAAFVAIAPPFAGAVPARVRVALAVGLGAWSASRLEEAATRTELTDLLAAVVYQVAVGVALGAIVYAVFAAFAAAGGLVDSFAGLTAGPLFDPTSHTSLGPSARLYQMVAIAVLFVTNGHLLLIGGMARSFDAAPLGGLRVERLAQMLTHDVGQFLVAGFQIAAPVLGALFVTELLLGLASRAAPQLNVLMLGFGVKSLVLMVVGSIALPILTFAVPLLVDRTVTSMWSTLR